MSSRLFKRFRRLRCLLGWHYGPRENEYCKVCNSFKYGWIDHILDLEFLTPYERVLLVEFVEWIAMGEYPELTKDLE